jgi:hypothetical protein
MRKNEPCRIRQCPEETVENPYAGSADEKNGMNKETMKPGNPSVRLGRHQVRHLYFAGINNLPE